jgi:hypothetical protein
VDEDFLIADAAVETLRREDGEFGFCQIEPTAVLWRVMPFEPLDEPSCFISPQLAPLYSRRTTKQCPSVIAELRSVVLATIRLHSATPHRASRADEDPWRP